MSEDLFPSTPESWIVRQLDEEGLDGRTAVNRNVMRIYSRPLRRYFDSTRDRWLDGGTEIVHGFFADRLERPEFFAAWQASGKPLRQWLKNAFSFYLKEERRKRRRERRVPEPERLAERAVPRPEDEFDRAYAQEIVREALESTHAACTEAGHELHWSLFHEHFYRGVPYRECAERHEITEEQAAVKARIGVRRFRRAVRRLLARDGFTSRHVDREIRALLEVTG